MNRSDIINHLIKKFNYKTYLEIGTQHGNCFSVIDIPEKYCVDPEKNYEYLTHEMTSDDFFNQNDKKFDIIFVDGLHTEEQTYTDILNSIKILNDNGSIVVHDCLPHCEEYIQICYSGTVFRSIIELRYNHPELDISVVDTDCGCGILRKKDIYSNIVYNKVPLEIAKSYSYYESNKNDLMNVITIEQFLTLYS